jgi:arylsulfatase A-like enzyme
VADGKVTDGWFVRLHHMEPHASYDPDVYMIDTVAQDALDPWPVDLTNRPNHYDARDDYGSMTSQDQDLLEAHLRILYEAEIRTLDDRMRFNWEELEEQGWLDDTLVVLWNDHGEQFWEHNYQTHAYQLYGEENDGYLIFWAKNMVPGTYDGPTTSIDLVPTILDLFGIDMPPEVTGYPIGTAPADRPRFAEALARLGGIQSISQDGYKLHYNWNGNVKFFDRNADPTETVDLYDPNDAMVLQMWLQLKPMIEAMAPLVVNEEPAPVWPPYLP